MAGPLDIAFSGADQSVRDPLIALPRTAGERFDAEWQATMAPDRYFRQDVERGRLWGEALDAYHRATGERLQNPYAGGIRGQLKAYLSPLGILGGAQTIGQDEARNVAIQKIRLAREQFPDLPDPELIDHRIAQEGRYRRERAARYQDTGNGLAAFAGGMLGETLTPHGIASLFAPPTRLATLPAQGAMRGFLGSVGREAFVQAQVGVGSQAAGELADYLARAPLGTEQTFGEIATNVIGAGVGGAVIGGGFRGLHEAWRRLRPEIRAAAPPEVKDAAAVIERTVLDEGTNPLPPQAGAVHEEALARAQNNVLQGKAAQVRDFVATASEDAVDGPYLLRGVMPEGPPGVAVETGRVRGTGFDLPERSEARPGSAPERLPETDRERYVVARNEAGQPVGVLRMTLADINGKKLDPDAGVTVYVTPEMRRQGIATSLYAEARRQGYDIDEVRGQGDLTPDGAALNRAMGEPPVPEGATRFYHGGNPPDDLDGPLWFTTHLPDAQGWAARAGDKSMGVWFVDVPKGDPRVDWGDPANGIAMEARQELPGAIASQRQQLTAPDRTVPTPKPAEPLPIPSRVEVEAAIKAQELPEAAKALDNQIAQMLEADPERTILISTDGDNVRSVKLKDLLEEARSGEKDAQSILSCVIGSAV